MSKNEIPVEVVPAAVEQSPTLDEIMTIIKEEFPVLFQVDGADEAMRSVIQTIKVGAAELARFDMAKLVISELGRVLHDDLADLEKTPMDDETLEEVRRDPQKVFISFLAGSYALILQGLALLMAGVKIPSPEDCDCPRHKAMREEKNKNRPQA